MALGGTLGHVRAMPAAEYAEWVAFDRVVGLPDHNAFQAHICQYLSNNRRATLQDFLLVPTDARREREVLSPEESAGLMSRGLPKRAGSGSG